MTTQTATWEQLAPQRGGLALLRPVDDDVVTLVRGIENRADRAQRRGETGADVAWLRAELAIEDELAA